MHAYEQAGFTDALDGWIARTWPSQATVIGGVIDPIADKFLICTVAVGLGYTGLVPIWLVGLMFGRDAWLIATSLYIRAVSLRGHFEKASWAQYWDFGYPTVVVAPTAASKVRVFFFCFTFAFFLTLWLLFFAQTGHIGPGTSWVPANSRLTLGCGLPPSHTGQYHGARIGSAGLALFSHLPRTRCPCSSDARSIVGSVRCHYILVWCELSLCERCSRVSAAANRRVYPSASEVGHRQAGCSRWGGEEDCRTSCWRGGGDRRCSNVMAHCAVHYMGLCV